MMIEGGLRPNVLLSSNKMTSGDSGQKPERAPISTIQELAEQYLLQASIFSGIDLAAVENNLKIIKILQESGEEISNENGNNALFAIISGGSREKGYSTRASDIDLQLVLPETVSTSAPYVKTLTKSLTEGLVTNPIEESLAVIAENGHIPTKSQTFYQKYYDEPDRIDILLCPTIYQTPNLRLAKLAALEIVIRDPLFISRWHLTQKIFNTLFLGDRDDHPRIAKNYGVEIEEVERVLPQSLYEKRYKKFGLKDPNVLLDIERQWYRENAKKLQGYTMKKVYGDVLKFIKDEGE